MTREMVCVYVLNTRHTHIYGTYTRDTYTHYIHTEKKRCIDTNWIEQILFFLF